MTAREIDVNGFIEIPNNPISKCGIFEYYGYEIDAPEPDKIYRVFRSPEELEKSVSLFNNKPIIKGHTMLGNYQVPAEKKGIDGIINNAFFKEGTVYGTLYLYTDRIKRFINSGKRELSLGYWSQYEFKKGTWQGMAYDAIQHIIDGNHLAVLDGDGRMGETVAVLDHAPKFQQLTFTFDHKGIPMDEDKDDAVATEDIEDVVEESAQHEVQEMATLKSVADGLAELNSKVDKLTEVLSKMHGVDQPTEDESQDDEIPTEDEDKVGGEEDEDKKPTMDAKAIARQVRAEIQRKDELVALVKPLIGTFDHSNMTDADVARYASKKLGLTGHAESAVRAYAAATKKQSIKATQDANPVEPKIKAGIYE